MVFLQIGNRNFDFNHIGSGEKSSHGHQQSHEAGRTRGEYRTVMPDGRIQVVSYVADENGYRAKITYEPDKSKLKLKGGLQKRKITTNNGLDSLDNRVNEPFISSTTPSSLFQGSESNIIPSTTTTFPPRLDNINLIPFQSQLSSNPTHSPNFINQVITTNIPPKFVRNRVTTVQPKLIPKPIAFSQTHESDLTKSSKLSRKAKSFFSPAKKAKKQIKIKVHPKIKFAKTSSQISPAPFTHVESSNPVLPSPRFVSRTSPKSIIQKSPFSVDLTAVKDVRNPKKPISYYVKVPKQLRNMKTPLSLFVATPSLKKKFISRKHIDSMFGPKIFKNNVIPRSNHHLTKTEKTLISPLSRKQKLRLRKNIAPKPAIRRRRIKPAITFVPDEPILRAPPSFLNIKSTTDNIPVIPYFHSKKLKPRKRITTLHRPINQLPLPKSLNSIHDLSSTSNFIPVETNEIFNEKFNAPLRLNNLSTPTPKPISIVSPNPRPFTINPFAPSFVSKRAIPTTSLPRKVNSQKFKHRTSYPKIKHTNSHTAVRLFNKIKRNFVNER